MTSRHPLLALLLTSSLVGLVPLQAGCAPLLSALPAVTSAVVEVGNIVDVIASWVALFFKTHPDPALEARIAEVVARARSAMNVVLRLGDSAKQVDDARVTEAFDDLETAYRELLDLTRPIGVRPEGIASGRVRAPSDVPVLTVPATLRRPTTAH